MSDLASKRCVPCEGGVPPLGEEEVRRLLGELDGWRLSSGGTPQIEKEYRFPDFREAMKFVRRVADLAEAMRHHPRIEVRLHRVTLTVTTDEEGGVTQRDIDLIRRIDG